VSFAEQAPSKQWAALKYRGERLAEVWFKPEGQPFALTFRVPQKSFQIPGLGERLTAETLLKAVAIGADEVECWRHGDVSHSSMNGSNPELRKPLPPPPPDASHLDIYVSLKPPPQAANLSFSPANEGITIPSIPADREAKMASEIPSATWLDLEARWKNILGLEATIDTLRLNMEGLRAEVEGASRRSLTMEERTYALNSDVSLWEKVKSRVHFTMPKMREFIHRATWEKGTPERKKLEELVKNQAESGIPVPEMDKVQMQLEYLLKDLQVLSARGVTVYQEGKQLSGDLQAALRTLQSNSAARARVKLSAARAKRKNI
jgi:hypothetical protein